MKKIFVVIFVMIGLIVCVHQAHATLVKALNIKQLTALSEQIVKASIIKKEVVDDQEESGAIVNCFTLNVLDRIKGKPSGADDEIIIKQLADGSTKVNGKTINQRFMFPSYAVGKKYLFFLPQAHHRTGLSAPIGLGQGVYEVRPDAKGQEQVVGLERRLKILGLEQARSDQSYESFKTLIQGSMESK